MKLLTSKIEEVLLGKARKLRLFHGTGKKVTSKHILERGLKPSGRAQRFTLSTREADARFYAKHSGKGRILEIHLPKSALERYLGRTTTNPNGSQWFQLERRLPGRYIKRAKRP